MDILSERVKCRYRGCKREIPFDSAIECSCNRKHRFCARCKVDECNAWCCKTHETCWNRHIFDHMDDPDEPHELVDHKVRLFSTIVNRSESEQKLRQPYERDRAARWFNIRHNGEISTLHVYDRFGSLCDPNRSGNVATVDQYPSIVSVIGKSGVGKSTLVRAMILLGAIDNSTTSFQNTSDPDSLAEFAEVITSPREVPVTKLGGWDWVADPTTFGVNLYKDECVENSESSKPIYSTLFADCEGFNAGNLIPTTQRVRRQQAETVSELDDGVIFEAEITSHAYRTKSKDGVDLFYARFLYAMSDVVVFVTNDDNIIYNSIKTILEWAAAAVLNSVNHTSPKTLVIVRQGGRHYKDFYDPEKLKTSYLRHEQKLWDGSKILEDFVEEYNSKQEMTECIYDNEALCRLMFADIHCCYIPNIEMDGVQPKELFYQYHHLRQTIDNASKASQKSREDSWTQYNVPTFSSLLLKAFEHFSTSDLAFDFYSAARNDNPAPEGYADHVANFLRLVNNHSINPIRSWEISKHIIALSLVVWALRHLRQWYNPDDIFDRTQDEGLSSLKKICEDALDHYETKYQECTFTFTNGDGCIIRTSRNHTYHESSDHRRVQGGLKPRNEMDLQQMVKSIRRCFVEYYRCLQSDGETFRQRADSLPKVMSVAKREKIMQAFENEWKRLRSNKTCLSCLQSVPEYVLLCGHALCVICVRELGTPSREYDSAWDIGHCPLCRQTRDFSHLVRLKPRCAGVRILTLDGGGVRGIIELALLRCLENSLGLGVELRDYFDLILGTSTGGIIALAIAMYDKKAEEHETSLNIITQEFITFATQTFKRPKSTGFLGTGIGRAMAKVAIALGLTDTMFDSEPLKQGLQKFFGKNTSLFSMARVRKHQCSTRVAVVATTSAGDTKCLIPSYNRPNLSNSPDFEREDDDDIGMKIWEAGMATSAAPFYLPPFKKKETGKVYVDGALYANCPAETALREMKHLWPREGASLDFLLSLGTGHQKKEIKIPKRIRIGGLEEIVRSFHNNLDTQRLWNEFLATDSAEAVKARLYRLNPNIDTSIGYVPIFHCEKMAEMQDMVEQNINLSEVQDIADQLLANLFYFEPDADRIVISELAPTQRRGNPLTISGTIRCRLSHGSSELEFLLAKVYQIAYASLRGATNSRAMDLPREFEWATIYSNVTGPNLRDEFHRFRASISIKGSMNSGDAHVIALSMKERPGKMVPISGFPMTFSQLIQRTNS